VLAEGNESPARVVVFAFPGGGYTKEYFDLRHPELDGPSQAEYHAARGVVFVACDPYGGGDSTPLPAGVTSLEATSRIFHQVVRDTIAGLRTGTLVDGLEPLDIAVTVGIGHSLGGMQLIAHQGGHGTFDAIAVLGFSAVHTRTPTPSGDVAPHGEQPPGTGEELDAAWAGPLVDDIANLRYAYHWEDVSPALVAEDMGAGFPTRTAKVLPPWISQTFPPFAADCMAPGVVANEAAAIEVPVFVGAGERDVVPSLADEARAYAASTDITLYRLGRSAHMHNFSPQRAVLWRRLQAWFGEISSTSQEDW
jgi:pimeloyl-ACP methyl ester carboxylesterase